VYVWGSNKEGQLGLGDEAEEISYTAERLVIDSNDSSIKDISCGYYHTALVTHTGELYTFGEADGGKLGLGEIGNNNQDTVDLPSKVDVPEKVFHKCHGTEMKCSLIWTLKLSLDSKLGLLFCILRSARFLVAEITQLHCLRMETFMYLAKVLTANLD